MKKITVLVSGNEVVLFLTEDGRGFQIDRSCDAPEVLETVTTEIPSPEEVAIIQGYRTQHHL